MDNIHMLCKHRLKKVGFFKCGNTSKVKQFLGEKKQGLGNPAVCKHTLAAFSERCMGHFC